MNQVTAKKLFEERFKFEPNDQPDASQTWSMFLDSLFHDGKITDYQRHSWSWENSFHC